MDHSWLGGSFWCITTSPGILFHGGMQALIYLQGEERVAFFRGSTESIEASSLVVSDLHKAFMSTVLECFDITLCQVTKVLALSFSVFLALRRYKLCNLPLTTIALPLGGGRLRGGGVPGVAAVAPGTSTDHQPWHTTPRLRPSVSDLLRIKKISGQICKGSVMCNT